jgi:glycosyltransferase involved in cell wall biosynthesis
MSGEALVSVIMTVRDGERFLREAIASVLGQTGVPLELIVVEDGSRDASAAIAASYGPPVRCISIEPGGIGHARNVGLDAARGEFVTFLDCDDLWPPDRLRIMLDAIGSVPSPDLVFGHELRFPLDATGPRPARNTTTVLLRRSTFERIGPFPTEWRLGEFLDLLMRAQDLGLTTEMLPDVVCYRRVHGGNLTIRERSEYRDYAKVLGRALARRRAREVRAE